MPKTGQVKAYVATRKVQPRQMAHGRPLEPGSVITSYSIHYTKLYEDRVLAVGERGHVEDRIVVGQGVVARVVAEGAFAAALAGFHVALQHELAVGRDLQVHGLALDELNRRLAQESGEEKLRN